MGHYCSWYDCDEYHEDETDWYFDAAKDGRINVVEKALEINSNLLNATDRPGGNTALHYAASHGNADIVKLLVLGYDADLHILDASGKTAMQVADK